MKTNQKVLVIDLIKTEWRNLVRLVDDRLKNRQIFPFCFNLTKKANTLAFKCVRLLAKYGGSVPKKPDTNKR